MTRPPKSPVGSPASPSQSPADMPHKENVEARGMADISGISVDLEATRVSGYLPVFTGSGVTLQPTCAPRQPRHRNGSSTAPAPPAILCGLEVGGFPLHEALLNPLPHATEAELKKLKQILTRELEYQTANPPALPRSQIPALPPKPRAREWVILPDGIEGAARRELEDQNNAIAAENQAVERDRNNMAAKKSRQVRLEALGNARALLNDKAAECAWLRLKVALLGGRPDEWNDGTVPEAVKAAMAAEVKERVAEVDARHAEEKKREEARKRAAGSTRPGAAKRRRLNSSSPERDEADDDGDEPEE
ncbi:hypothetical protein HJFPF1_03328 [Paramyrothecium foliicola]|nr:hypothetical protein HJFPF1_03328 [Paramyrothecium foliicola]